MAELDFNSLIRLTSESDRETTLQVGVWNGSTSFTVFKKGTKGTALKISAPLSGRLFLMELLNKVIANPNESQEKQKIHTWDKETKKTDLQGTVIFGRNDKGLLYMGVSGPNFPGQRFPFRPSMLYGADEQWTEVKKSEVAAKEFIKILELKVLMAECLTSFKREFTGTGGGRPGAGGGDVSTGDMF